MSEMFFPLLVILVLLAVFIQEPMFATIVYLMVGIFLLGRWWSNRSMNGFRYERRYTNRAFPGEVIQVEVKISNKGWLPILWLQLSEKLPVELVGNQTFTRVAALSPSEEISYGYTLHPQKRGYYEIGPLSIHSGDLLGLTRVSWAGKPEYLMVYPRIIGFSRVPLPSRSPMGSIRHKQILLEDPNRIIGKREYQIGDAPKKIDWKSTAAVGRLQVKQMESSISLDTAIFLDFSKESYHYRRRLDSTELAVVTAASVANWMIAQRQQVAFYTNALDAYEEEPTRIMAINSNKGQAHLMRILETLAKVKLSDNNDFMHFLRQERVNLPWGTTVMIITGKPTDQLFEEMYIARRQGLNLTLVLCGLVGGLQEIKARGMVYGIPVSHFMDEQDFEIWQ